MLRPEDAEYVNSDSPSGSDQEQEVIGEDPANYSSEENVDDNIMLWQRNPTYSDTIKEYSTVSFIVAVLFCLSLIILTYSQQSL